MRTCKMSPRRSVRANLQHVYYARQRAVEGIVRLRDLSAVLAVCAAAAPLLIARQQQPAETFRSGREILTINASVRDASGRPLSDLQPSEFSVRIDGEPRRVLTARVFGTQTGTSAVAASPTAHFLRNTDVTPGRVVVFAVDRESIRAGSERALLDTAAKLLGTLSPADAAGAIALPGAGTDLTRDHAAVAQAIGRMTGTQPPLIWTHEMSRTEALAYERGDTMAIRQVVDRECRERDPDQHAACIKQLVDQARELLLVGRAHADSVLANLTRVLDNLRPIRAPKHVVVISAGLPFDVELLPGYQALALRAAQGHVALFVVHLDQSSFDASDVKPSAGVVGGREQVDGLATIASITGGQFFNGVSKATGAFEQIAADINTFYELGVESIASDADGKPHKVEVHTARAGATVRAPAATAASPSIGTGKDAVSTALAEPTDITALPLEVAAYMTHSVDPEKVRVLVAATVPPDATVDATQWGAAIVAADGKIAGAVAGPVQRPAAGGWSTTGTIDVAPGRYRLRTAIVDGAGRIGTLEMPLTVGMRGAGAVMMSDVIVGIPTEGRLAPRPRIAQRDSGLGMIELSSSESLADTTGYLQLVPAGGTAPALRRPLPLRTRADDKSIVVGEAALDLSSLAPGTYTASAVLERAGAAFARVSRLVDVVPGGTMTAPVAPAAAASPAAAAVSPTSSAPAPPDVAMRQVLERVGRYVADYGQQMSLIVGSEHYEQGLLGPTGLEVAHRKSEAEFALVKTADSMGWSGFRDVIEVDGHRVGKKQDRLQTLFRSASPDGAEARRIADESARFNLGSLHRNFNDPTAALFFLVPSLQPHFAFTRKAEATVDGTPVWEIDFEEKIRPTLNRTTIGKDVPSKGTLWVVPGDGTVVRTRLSISGFAGLSSSLIDVAYAHDERLAMWLPRTMKERHEVDAVVSGRSAFGVTPASRTTNVVVATATYADFKRFETSGTFKIK